MTVDGTARGCSRRVHGHGREEHDSAVKVTLLHTSATGTKDDKISAHVVAMKECESEGAVAMWHA